MSLKGTLNFEITLTVNNVEELVEKTNMIARILKGEGSEILAASDSKIVSEEAHGALTRPLSNLSSEMSNLSSEMVEILKDLRDADALSFTANVVAFDDTFRSQEADPIWGLAFTSRDITEGKNIGAYLRKKQKVKMTIRKLREGEE